MERLALEGLRYAQAVAETRSFSAAARAYGVTQPALSNGIAKLERHLGDKLFDRTTRGVTPTPFGARILPLIATAITSLDTITAEARRLTAPTEPKVRMGVSPLISSAVIARAFSAVCTLSSKRDLVLREADMDELRSSLLAQELDVILIPAVAPMPRFEHRTIEIEPMVVVDREEQGPGDGGPADPEAAEVFELAEAHREQFILVPDTCGLTRFTSNLFTENDLPLQTYTGKPSNYRALEEWVALGLGLAILPAPKLTSPAVPHRTLVNQGRPVTISYEAVWSTTSPLAGDLETLVTGMLEAAPSLSGAHTRGQQVSERAAAAGGHSRPLGRIS